MATQNKATDKLAAQEKTWRALNDVAEMAATYAEHEAAKHGLKWRLQHGDAIRQTVKRVLISNNL